MKREKRRKIQHRMRNIALAKNNKLNKLYVFADVAGAHINPVETHEIIYGVEKEPATTFPLQTGFYESSSTCSMYKLLLVDMIADCIYPN
jgi:hypothetical protein